jgi:hypothetical protein
MEIAKIVDECMFLDLELPDQKPVITIQNKFIAYPQNFICINGLPKSYKTTFAGFFIQSALSKKCIFDIEVNLDPDKKIILIDTEQSIYDFSRQVKNLKRNIKKNSLPDNFKAYLFRKYDPDVIIKAITEIIIQQQPSILIIDNLTELVNSPNDIPESKAVITWLKKVTAEYNLVIICLLHNAKSTMMSTGNLGSLADRGSQSTVTVKHNKEENTTTMEATLMRSDSYFNPVTIKYDIELKNFIQIETENKPKINSRKFVLMDLTNEDHFNRLRIIFIKTKSFVYSEFVNEITKMYGIGINIAKTQVIPYLRGNEFVLAEDGIYEFNKNKTK